MCTYTYSWYICNHDYYIWTDSVEVCSNRLLSGYSADAWSIGERATSVCSWDNKPDFIVLDMCKHHIAICKGFGEYYCRDCSEDYTLEYELEE